MRHIDALHCPDVECSTAILHTCRRGQRCRHDAGLEMLRHVQLEHPLMAYEVGEFNRIVERMRLFQMAHDRRN